MLARFISGQLYAIAPLYAIISLFAHSVSIVPNTKHEWLVWGLLTLLGMPLVIRGERLARQA